jgi:hypothetical protein
MSWTTSPAKHSCHEVLPYHRPKSNGTCQPWTETPKIVSQEQTISLYKLIISGTCYHTGKVTNRVLHEKSSCLDLRSMKRVSHHPERVGGNLLFYFSFLDVFCSSPYPKPPCLWQQPINHKAYWRRLHLSEGLSPDWRSCDPKRMGQALLLFLSLSSWHLTWDVGIIMGSVLQSGINEILLLDQRPD